MCVGIDIKRETGRICDANSRLDRVVPYSGYSQQAQENLLLPSTRTGATFFLSESVQVM